MNPCPCGYYPDMNRCRCTSGQVSRYLNKISQPLLDRLDLCAEAEPVSFSSLNGRQGEASDRIRKRVEKVHEIQRNRYQNENIQFNGELKGNMIEAYCRTDDQGKALLEAAFDRMDFSARACLLYTSGIKKRTGFHQGHAYRPGDVRQRLRVSSY